MTRRKWTIALLVAAAVAAALVRRPVRQPAMDGTWQPADAAHSPR